MSDFICPINTPRLTSKYGMRFHPIHKKNMLHGGIDLVNQIGGKVPVYASADGKVRIVKTTALGYGKYVVITHSIKGKKYESLYAHLDSYSVKQGQIVKQGQQIGILGTTGTSTGLHLHYELHNKVYDYCNGTYPNSFDPMKVTSLDDTPNKLSGKSKVTSKPTIKEDDNMKFSSKTTKDAVRDKLQQSVNKKLIDKSWLTKFDKGELTHGDYVGLEIIISQRS